jgi:hypothetical protein
MEKRWCFLGLIVYVCKDMGFLNQRILIFREVTNAENTVKV